MVTMSAKCFITTNMPQELNQVKVHALMQTGYKAWDEDILYAIYSMRGINLILQVPLSSRCTSDSWYWIHDNDGDFTVRSCYR